VRYLRTEHWGDSVDFLALDFETANADFSSVCQVGAVIFTNGEPADSFVSLVDPQDYFDGMNVSIHGIDEEDVRGAPTFKQIHEKLSGMMRGRVVVSHTSFDRSVLLQSESRHRLIGVECRWLDTAMVVRRTWPKYARQGYGLSKVAEDLGIDFRHHDAAEYARAAGKILVHVIRETGLNLERWLERVRQPLNPEDGKPISRDGNADGPLYGEVAVFTGALSMRRKEAADKAALAGCRVDAGVTKETTVLIVGDQDVVKLAPGQSKSSKHLKAETLIAKGQRIRILRETDFAALCSIVR
jgi:DNA polymerase III subunit epsilon